MPFERKYCTRCKRPIENIAYVGLCLRCYVMFYGYFAAERYILENYHLEEK